MDTYITVMLLFYFQKRIRSSDLVKSARCVGESKYDFSKIIKLKGATGRDVSKKGRPEGITSTASHVQETSSTSMIVANEDAATQFLFVSRRAMSFEGDFHWIYTCSCDVAGTELIECCGQQMEVTFADFKARIPGCIHTNVVGTLLEQFDAQNMINPDDSEEIEDDSTINAGDNEESVEEEITELNDGLFLIKSSKGLGVVLQGQSGTKCLTCNASVVKCKHLEMFINSRGEREKESNTNRSYQQRCYSLAKISFNSNFGMQETYKKELTDRFLVEDDVISLKPEVEMCDVCGIILTEKEDKITANIFMMNKVLKANVSVKQCSGCEKQFHFDGLDQCILNMGRNVFCHEILRRFMYYFLSGKSTIFTEYQVLCQTLSDAGYVDIGGENDIPRL
ncbi:unnamed protein product [Mytilus edulis]|uniref:Uncharacterized protein n=1 Tax=Mytilus edulis TaxID=6550 RepID=A0A8S3TXE4_MYTED|nr:unnamed protein product [Mytilus edulis]